MWKVSLNENGLVDGFYPADYSGTLPETTLIDVDDDEHRQILKMMPACYVKGQGFTHWTPPAPSLDELKLRKKGEIAAARYEKETGGVEVGGAKIATDRGSQALLTAAVVTARFDPEFQTKWKCDDGTFVTLDAMQLRAIGDAVTAFIEACFTQEGELCALIDAAQTKEELDAIEITF